LLSAALFGGGDFGGGVVTRHSRHFQVLAWSALSGVLSLGMLTWLTGESLPSPTSVLWAAGAGLSGSLGLLALYRALAQGSAAVVSPLAGVIGAVMPVVVVAFAECLPGPTRVLGFASTMLGIGLVARASSAQTRCLDTR
jgi:uncharacterized membrane protein